MSAGVEESVTFAIVSSVDIENIVRRIGPLRTPSLDRGQMLGAERLVRQRLHVADAEVAIELVERRRAEGFVRGGGEGEVIRGVDEQRHARTPGVVAAIGQRRAVALRIEVAPRIETDSARSA